MKLAVNETTHNSGPRRANLAFEFMMRWLTQTIVLGVVLFLGSLSAQATTFQVTTTADNGNNLSPTAGSLRKAIIDANANPGSDAINFHISGAGVNTISPPAPFQNIIKTLTIK